MPSRRDASASLAPAVIRVPPRRIPSTWTCPIFITSGARLGKCTLFLEFSARRHDAPTSRNLQRISRGITRPSSQPSSGQVRVPLDNPTSRDTLVQAHLCPANEDIELMCPLVCNAKGYGNDRFCLGISPRDKEIPSGARNCHDGCDRGCAGARNNTPGTCTVRSVALHASRTRQCPRASGRPCDDAAVAGIL